MANKEVKRLKSVPKGFVLTVGATAAPRGYRYYNNGKSRFSGNREIVLVEYKK